MVDARGTDFVDDFDDPAVLGAGVALDVNSMVHATGEDVLDLVGERFLFGPDVLEIDGAVFGDRDNDGVVLVGFLHLMGVVGHRQVDRRCLLQHGCDDHEDDQKHEHDVGHGDDVGRRHLVSDLWLVGHRVSFAPATSWRRGGG